MSDNFSHLGVVLSVWLNDPLLQFKLGVKGRRVRLALRYGVCRKTVGLDSSIHSQPTGGGPGCGPIEASQGLCVPVHRVARMDDGWQGRWQCARMEYLVLWTIALAVT